MNRFELVVLSDADVDEVLNLCSCFETDPPCHSSLVNEDFPLTVDQSQQAKADRGVEMQSGPFLRLLR